MTRAWDYSNICILTSNSNLFIAIHATVFIPNNHRTIANILGRVREGRGDGADNIERCLCS